jgi:phosphoribosyl 1,2-cyclic phosphodiesterase
MTDRHLHILRHMARQRQRVLQTHDDVDHAAGTGSAARRRRLAQAVERTGARVRHAEARRDAPQPD